VVLKNFEGAVVVIEEGAAEALLDTDDAEDHGLASDPAEAWLVLFDG